MSNLLDSLTPKETLYRVSYWESPKTDMKWVLVIHYHENDLTLKEACKRESELEKLGFATLIEQQ